MEIRQLKYFVKSAEYLNFSVAAKHLYITLEASAGGHTAHFRNDGSCPTKEIVEGGGLSSLRRKIEEAGGRMTVGSTPSFVLTVTLPGEGGESA